MRVLSRAFCLAVLGLIATMPLIAAWNAFAPEAHQIRFGRHVYGRVAPVPRTGDLWHGFLSGELQKWVAAKSIDLLPARSLMIRLSNEIQFSLFRASGSLPHFVIGKDDFLVGRGYAADYCRLDMVTGAPRAREWAARIRQIQDFYTSRGKRFVYLTSPSKFSVLYDKFKHKIACHNPDRDAFIPFLAEQLRLAGVNFIDGATIAVDWQQANGMASFGSGAGHWNDAIIAQVTAAIIRAANGDAPILPPLSWQSAVSPVAIGRDRDLVELLNLQRTEWRHPSHVITFNPSRSCPTGPIEVTFVGTSFTTALAETLQQTGCVRTAAQYFYLHDLYRFTARPGPDGQVAVARRDIAHEMKRDQLLELRRADVVIFEENVFVAGQGYALEFYRLLVD
jgi:alginate O-acetyltransferase complex protein AlgJ